MSINKNCARLFFLTCLLIPSLSLAAVFNVDTDLDAIDILPGDGLCRMNANDTRCSLRAAIMEANALVNDIIDGEEVPDEINIADGRYHQNIREIGEDLSVRGDLDITDSVILRGNSADRNAVIIDGASIFSGPRDRVLHIFSDEKEISVELHYLTITGGYSNDTRSGGGGICIQCVASDSEAYQPTGLGTQDPDINTTFNPVSNFSNINLIRPKVLLSHVEVHSNFDLLSGSGIMNAGILTIEDSVIRDNFSSFRFFMATGQNGQFTNNSQFIGGGNGGGISNWGGKLTVRRSIIQNNISQIGGAIYSQTLLSQFRDEQVIIEDSQITGNQAFMGGGIFNVSGDWNFPSRTLIDYGFIINQSTIDSNVAAYAGGGIYNLGLGAMQLSNVTVSNNSAADIGRPLLPNKGGGIYHSGKILDLVNTTVSGNISQNPRLADMPIADDATGGTEVFLDVTQANIDPLGNLPWRFSLMNTILGDTNSSDACNGTSGYEDFIISVGGNVDESGTCALANINNVVNGGPLNKTSNRASEQSISLAALANNGGLAGKELPDGTFPPTRAILTGSAVNTGINCNSQDQRGFGRESSACDPGSFQTASNTKGESDIQSQLPVARNDSITTALGINVMIPVTKLLANDNDPLQRSLVVFNKSSVLLNDENAVSISIGRGSQANNTGQIDFVYFTPVDGFVGETSFSYTVSIVDPDSNETLNSEMATVTVLIKDQNIAPIAYSQTFTVAPGDSKTSDLTGGLSSESSTVYSIDPEQGELGYFLQADPAKGTITISEEGGFTYTANGDASGTDSFTYVVKDTGGLSSKPAAVSIYFESTGVSGLSDITANAEAGKNTKIQLGNSVTANLFFGLSHSVFAAKGDILWLNERSGELLYKANEDVEGDDRLAFTAYDLDAVGQTTTFDGTVTISISAASGVNNEPQAESDEVDLGTELFKQIFLAGSDADDDVLFYEIIDTPLKGELSQLDPVTGSIIYTPNPHVSGSDSFTFRTTDGFLQSSAATISINLAAQTNQLPIALDDIAMTPNDLTISINVLANDSDGNNDVLSVSTDSDSSEQGGVVTVSRKGIIRYTPPANFEGEDSIQYQVDDGQNGTATATLKVSVIAASISTMDATPPGNNDQETPGSNDQSDTSNDQSTTTDQSSDEVSTSASAVSFWLIWLSLVGLLVRLSQYRRY